MTDQNDNAILEQIHSALEREGMEQSESLPMRPQFVSVPPIQPTTSAPTPIDDLRARIAVCKEAWVTRYRDGDLEITFDTDARRNAGDTPIRKESF